VCTNFTPTKQNQWVKEKFGVDLPADYPSESYPGFAAPLVWMIFSIIELIVELGSNPERA
jgi:hypothetical protein